MKILKFGGKSLSNGEGLKKVLSIIESKISENSKFIAVCSARDNTTDTLERILEKAKKGDDFTDDFQAFKKYQIEPANDVDLTAEFNILEKTFEGVKLIEEYSLKVKDLVLAQGEIISVKLISHILNLSGIKCTHVDSRDLFVTNSSYGSAHPFDDLSNKNTINYFNNIDKDTLPIVTGFIASDKRGNTTTLGRNGSNFSASLLAKYLNAEEVLSYTHVNGIYTANPDLVEDARIIRNLSYQEANELACFGTSILHAKTIIPLVENNIPLRILNTFKPDDEGTIISNVVTKRGVKSISIEDNVCVIYIEGKGMLGKTGIDARIFNTLEREKISIGVISQGSSERSVAFVVGQKNAKRTVSALRNEFDREISDNDISSIYSIDNVSVVTVVGQNLRSFSASYQSLTRNNIDILLTNNTITGNNISLVIENKNILKAVNVIHSQIFGIAKKINIAIFGKGTVGGTLIDQILKSHDKIEKRKETKLNIFAIVGTKKILFSKNGISSNWKQDYENSPIENSSIESVIEFAEQNHMENLIAIDNTADYNFINNYTTFIENGFDLISSNKIANTVSYDYYKELRNSLKQYNKQYLYETNVGAGLPLIDTIKLLHDSGESITRIKGIFSGSLSYIFNNFSLKDEPFDKTLKEAIDKGYTEPDPREDLCGNDVARKLLILARELDLENEFEEINIKNLIPEELRADDADTFLANLNKLNSTFDTVKANQKPDHVLRYVGDLHGDLQKKKGILDVTLVSVPKSSSLGQVCGSNSIFEIYTESYGDNPIVIQGAGAGAEVTARGVFGDLLRIADKK